MTATELNTPLLNPTHMVVKPDPDPTERTMEALAASEKSRDQELTDRAEIRQREHAALQELIEARMSADSILSTERVASIRREIDIRETYRRELKSDDERHRLELKSDGEKTLTTATIAAEKAVQAALAAAEKARDQQTIASQLATTKAEEASKEQMKQQGETFGAAITGLTVSVGDMKGLISELRAERRGEREQIIVARDSASDMKPVLDAIAGLQASQSLAAGGHLQTVDARARYSQLWAATGVIIAALSVIGIILIAVLKH